MATFYLVIAIVFALVTIFNMWLVFKFHQNQNNSLAFLFCVIAGCTSIQAFLYMYMSFIWMEKL